MSIPDQSTPKRRKLNHSICLNDSSKELLLAAVEDALEIFSSELIEIASKKTKLTNHTNMIRTNSSASTVALPSISQITPQIPLPLSPPMYMRFPEQQTTQRSRTSNAVNNSSTRHPQVTTQAKM
jgi:hypothetical protein